MDIYIDIHTYIHNYRWKETDVNTDTNLHTHIHTRENRTSSRAHRSLLRRISSVLTLLQITSKDGMFARSRYAGSVVAVSRLRQTNERGKSPSDGGRCSMSPAIAQPTSQCVCVCVCVCERARGCACYRAP